MAHSSHAKALWKNQLDRERSTDSSWTLKSLIAPFGIWLLLNVWSSFERDVLGQSTLVITILVAVSVGSFIALRLLRRSRSRDRLFRRRAALILAQYNTVMVISLSSLSLRLAYVISVQFGIPSWVQGIYLVTYFLVIALALLMAPSSLPSSGELEEANRKYGPWIPRLVAAQATAVGIGVFMGAWAMHSAVQIGSILVMALALLIAYFLVAIGMIGIHRSLLLARTVWSE